MFVENLKELTIAFAGTKGVLLISGKKALLNFFWHLTKFFPFLRNLSTKSISKESERICKVPQRNIKVQKIRAIVSFHSQRLFSRFFSIVGFPPPSFFHHHGCFIMIDGTKSLLPVVREDSKGRRRRCCDLDFLIRLTDLNWVLLLLSCHLWWHRLLRFEVLLCHQLY